MGSRLDGRATPQGTRRAAARFGATARPLGNTGLVVTPLGFGGRRLRDDELLHARALRLALDGGVNLLQAGSRDGGGRSERLVGRVLAEAVRDGAVARDEIVVVLHLGAAPSESPRQDVSIRALADALGLEHVDVVMLDVASEPSRDSQGRLAETFASLEAQVGSGLIGAWGVSSEGFTEREESASYTSLAALLELAAVVGGNDHHLAVVGFPLNAFELGAVVNPHADAAGRTTMGVVADAGLGVVVERPLRGRYSPARPPLRLVEPRGDAPQVAAALAQLRKLEAIWAGELGRRIRTEAGDATDLFRWGQFLAQVMARGDDLSSWERVRYEIVAPHVGQTSAALLANLQGPDRDAFARWWQAYGTGLHVAFTAIETQLRTTPPHQLVSAAIDPFLPGAWRSLPLSCRAVAVALSAPISSVAVGMPTPASVAELLALRNAPVLAADPDFVGLAARTAGLAAELAQRP